MKALIKSTYYKVEDLLYKDPVRIDWVREKNFGDVLNPVLASYITDRPILHVNPMYYSKSYVSAIGSICGRVNENGVIWGSGFISQEIPCKKPKKICAVRGPLTAEKYSNTNYVVPKIYGDPALLISRYYKPNVEKKYKIGLVPHYVDNYAEFVIRSKGKEDVKVINLINSDPLEVISQMLECEVILSSSLHGLIVADAYGIKNKWISLSDKIVGGDFKFRDYYSSLNINDEKPLFVSNERNIFNLAADSYLKEINLDLDKLLEVCPFNER